VRLNKISDPARREVARIAGSLAVVSTQEVSFAVVTALPGSPG
jgi:hypothetical protein